MSGRALVTGASGFLGRPLVTALLGQGREVVALCRRPQALADLAPRRLELRAGDVVDESSWRDALTPGTTVFHLASARPHPRQRAARLTAVNTGATLALARASAERGVARFIHVASALVFGPANPHPRREQDGLAPAPGDLYAESRAAAIAGLQSLAAGGLHALTLCPAVTYGPDHPAHPNRVTTEIRRLLKTRIELLPAGGAPPRDLVFRDDLVAALLAAEERGAPGEIFLLGGEAAAQRDFNRRVLAAAGLRPRLRLVLPRRLLVAAGRAADRLLRLERGSGYTQDFATLAREWRFDCAAARAALGYRPTSLDEGLGRTVAWLRAVREARSG
jgi:nucleoside-diphosphate-sugar epimerase